MRTRSIWAATTALLSGLALAQPISSALGAHAAPGAGATGAAAARPAGRPGTELVLPTGDLVRVAGTAAKPTFFIRPAAASGIGQVLIHHRIKNDTYVIPADAQPYLGRILDRNLFDVNRIQAAQASGTGEAAKGRLPVRLSYSGAARPAVPGVTITSASGGVASGYLTAKSSRAFGKALAAQWWADRKAGWPKRTSLFGVTRLSAGYPGQSTAKPLYKMYTLAVKVTGADGKPQPYGNFQLFNVDDETKFDFDVQVVDGEARASVPAGHYSAVGVDALHTASGLALKVLTLNEYKVTGDGQTLSLDYTSATQQATVSAPKTAAVQNYGMEWDRIDATGDGSIYGGFSAGQVPVFYNPAGAPKVGKVDFTQNWNLAGPGDVPGYTYDLATYTPRIPADLHSEFTSAEVGTVNASYYGQGPGGPRTGGLVRVPDFAGTAGIGAGDYAPLALGHRRTEYVGSKGGHVIWSTGALLNFGADDDPGFVDAPEAAVPAGSTSSAVWFRGPLGAGIPRQGAGGFCFACRSSTILQIQVNAFLDSSPSHSGRLAWPEDGLPVARFRFYKNGKLLEDQDAGRLGDDFTVKVAKASYKAVFDVDRRLQFPNQSTQSHTELTFSSAAKSGGKLPGTWGCVDETTQCRVLPVVQAKLALPTALDGTLPAGKSKITVTVAGIQYAKASKAKSATLEIRAAGGFWQPVKLTSAGAGKFTGTIDDTDLAGSAVDVRLKAANAAGSKFSQTVLRAYTVAGS